MLVESVRTYLKAVEREGFGKLEEEAFELMTIERSNLYEDTENDRRILRHGGQEDHDGKR